jgi:hypothetical protein
MTETPHPQVAALFERYRRELKHTMPSDSLDARIAALVAGAGEIPPRRQAPARRFNIAAIAAAAGLASLAIAAGILIGRQMERDAPAARLAQQDPALPADFSLWPADSVALQIPAEYSRGGRLVAVDPNTRSSGKRYWIDVVVSNDGTVRIDRIVPAEPLHKKNGAPDGITLQTP